MAQENTPVNRWRQRGNTDIGSLLSTAIASIPEGDVNGASLLLELIAITNMPVPIFVAHHPNTQATKAVAVMRLFNQMMQRGLEDRCSMTVIGKQSDGRIALVSVDLVDGDTVTVPLSAAEAESLGASLLSLSRELNVVQSPEGLII